MKNSIKDFFSLYISKNELESDKNKFYNKYKTLSPSFENTDSESPFLLELFLHCYEQSKKLFKNDNVFPVFPYGTEIFQIIFESCIYFSLITFENMNSSLSSLPALDEFKHFYYWHERYNEEHTVPYLQKKLDESSYNASNSIYHKNVPFLEKEISRITEHYRYHEAAPAFRKSLAKMPSIHKNLLNYSEASKSFDCLSKDFSLFLLEAYSEPHVHLLELNRLAQTISNQLQKLSNEWNNILYILDKILSMKPNMYNMILENFWNTKPNQTFNELNKDRLNSIANENHLNSSILINIIYNTRSELTREETKYLDKVSSTHKEQLIMMRSSFQKKNGELEYIQETCWKNVCSMISDHKVAPRKEIPNEIIELINAFHRCLEKYNSKLYPLLEDTIMSVREYYITYRSESYNKINVERSTVERLTDPTTILSLLKMNYVFSPDLLNYFFTPDHEYTPNPGHDLKVYNNRCPLNKFKTLSSQISISFARDKIIQHFTNSFAYDYEDCLSTFFDTSYPVLCHHYLFSIWEYIKETNTTPRDFILKEFKKLIEYYITKNASKITRTLENDLKTTSKDYAEKEFVPFYLYTSDISFFEKLTAFLEAEQTSINLHHLNNKERSTRYSYVNHYLDQNMCQRYKENYSLRKRAISPVLYAQYKTTEHGDTQNTSNLTYRDFTIKVNSLRDWLLPLAECISSPFLSVDTEDNSSKSDTSKNGNPGGSLPKNNCRKGAIKKLDF